MNFFLVDCLSIGLFGLKYGVEFGKALALKLFCPLKQLRSRVNDRLLGREVGLPSEKKRGECPAQLAALGGGRLENHKHTRSDCRERFALTQARAPNSFIYFSSKPG